MNTILETFFGTVLMVDQKTIIVFIDFDQQYSTSTITLNMYLQPLHKMTWVSNSSQCGESFALFITFIEYITSI